jgi:hypothetical protein
MKALRYQTKHVPISWFASLKGLVFGGQWKRFRVEFEAIAPGEPGYEDAPYESSIFIARSYTLKELEEHDQ